MRGASWLIFFGMLYVMPAKASCSKLLARLTGLQQLWERQDRIQTRLDLERQLRDLVELRERFDWTSEVKALAIQAHMAMPEQSGWLDVARKNIDRLLSKPIFGGPIENDAEYSLKVFSWKLPRREMLDRFYQIRFNNIQIESLNDFLTGRAGVRIIGDDVILPPSEERASDLYLENLKLYREFRTYEALYESAANEWVDYVAAHSDKIHTYPFRGPGSIPTLADLNQHIGELMHHLERLR